jgi:hypothetical protein
MQGIELAAVFLCLCGQMMGNGPKQLLDPFFDVGMSDFIQ